MINAFCERVGMRNTAAETKGQLGSNRASFYYRNVDTGLLENVPEVDASGKVAGAGMLSSVPDLLTLGNALLYSHQPPSCQHPNKAPLLSKATLDEWWRPHVELRGKKTGGRGQPWTHYCLGWGMCKGSDGSGGGLPSIGKGSAHWLHDGMAVGATAMLFVKPSDSSECESMMAEEEGVSLGGAGICVAVLANCRTWGLDGLARELVSIFEPGTR